MSTNSERGFTLIEVLFAMVILTVALVSMAELMAITLRMQMMGRNETAAIRMAQSKVDELVFLDFDGPSASPLILVGGGLDADVPGYNDDPAPGYHRRWEITAIAGETDVRMLTVRIIPDVADRRTNADIRLTTIIRNCCPPPT
ncbi:MAG TPA: prepilin-type N-terminal cleavage/methylation domain-containing protein [Vicinamibacterales bacterium]|nr:prepilin-type N-terminal cleavage/methylation domain-containing protein [Vicinamibacterales bacterium]